MKASERPHSKGTVLVSTDRLREKGINRNHAGYRKMIRLEISTKKKI